MGGKIFLSQDLSVKKYLTTLITGKSGPPKTKRCGNGEHHMES